MCLPAGLIHGKHVLRNGKQGRGETVTGSEWARSVYDTVTHTGKWDPVCKSDLIVRQHMHKSRAAWASSLEGPVIGKFVTPMSECQVVSINRGDRWYFPNRAVENIAHMYTECLIGKYHAESSSCWWWFPSCSLHLLYLTLGVRYNLV